MNNSIVRIQKLEINNFMNVEHGVINFVCSTKENIFENGADILGIYGQNGSGKTASLIALRIFQSLISGESLPDDIYSRITVNKNEASFAFELSLITSNEKFYKIIYKFSLQKRENTLKDKKQNSISIFHEALSYSIFKDNKWTKFKNLYVDFNDTEIFGPKVRFNEITMKKQEVIDIFRVAKILSMEKSSSFIFSKYFIEEIGKDNQKEEYRDIIIELYNFSMINLHIIGNENSGLISANIMIPFCFKINDENNIKLGYLPIKLHGSSTITQEEFSMTSEIIDTTNIVLKKIIPEFRIKLIDLGKTLLEDGIEGRSVELLSCRSGIEIPLKYESNGIIKIVSIMHMLISMYNNPSLTLAIDEIDSGIFEYLLGEILKIISETGKGQLIFTSHNLRPLELLPKESIIFTTVNAKNRYIRLKNVKTNNNLRDMYYHDIILGGQNETLYDETNSFEISRAFRMAGEVSGKKESNLIHS